MRIKDSVWLTAGTAAVMAWLLLILWPSLAPTHVWQLIGPRAAVMDFLWLSALIAVILACLQARYGSRSNPGPDTAASTTPRIISDRAIATEGEDLFKRGHMAAVLAKELVLPHGSPSVVIGLEGPWGSGKSSLLALVEKRLIAFDPRPVIIHFNPWILSSVGDLLDAFFRQLADECAGQGASSSLVSAFDRFRREVERDRVDGLVRMALQLWQIISRIVFKPSENPDLLSRREAISGLLDNLERPVVVLVDDVDRLPAEQIRSVFQLVKAVGDFNRIAYIIAYDPAPVSLALGSGEPSQGQSFKDKIIQVMVPFPRDPFPERKSFVRTIVTTAATRWNAEVNDAERGLLEVALPVFTRVVSTPRQVKIAVNQAFLLAAILKFQVAFADLVAFGILSVRFPEVVTRIRRQPTLVTRRKHLDEEYINSDFLDYVKKPKRDGKEEDPLLANLTSVYPDQVDQDQATALILFLFPEKVPEDAKSLNRLRDDNNFLQLLYCGVRGNIFSNEDVNSVIRSVEERHAILDQYSQDEVLPGFLGFATTRIGPTVQVAQLDDLLVSLVDRAKAAQEAGKADIVNDVSTFALATLRNSANSPESKLLAVHEVVLNTSFLSPGEEVLLGLLSSVGLWKQGKWLGVDGRQPREGIEWFTDAEAEALRAEWISLVRSVPIDLLMRREPRVISILHRLGQLAPDDYSHVKRELGIWLTRSKENVIYFSEHFPRGTSFSGTDALVPEEMDLVGEFIAAMVPGRLIERLQEDCPSLAERHADEPTDDLPDAQDIDPEP